MTNRDWEQFIDNYNQGYGANLSHIKVMDYTPLLIQKITGVYNNPIFITKAHLDGAIFDAGKDTSIHYHGMGKDVVKQLPNMISNPVIVMKSITQLNQKRYCIVSTVKDSKNCPVIVALQCDGVAKDFQNRLVANIVTSFYGKDNFANWLNKNMQANSIIFVDERKKNQLLVPRVQFSNEVIDSSNLSLRLAGENVKCSKRILNKLLANQEKFISTAGEQGCPADFTNYDIENEQFNNLDLRGADFSYARINNVEFNNCLLDKAQFMDTALTAVSFNNCSFNNVDFSELKFIPNGKINLYTQCKTTNVIWPQTPGILMEFIYEEHNINKTGKNKGDIRSK